jgi:hypothetical protein
VLARLTSWVRARWVGSEELGETPGLEVHTPTALETATVVARSHSAVDILRNEPDLDAATLAARAGVTLSYARSLVRRRQAKSGLPPPRIVTPDGSVSLLQSQVRELSRRVEQTQDRIARPPSSLSRRTQVLDRQAAGIASKRIAEELEMPIGEVDFIVKIDRIKKSLKN